MHSVNPDQYYTDVIARPIVRKVLHLPQILYSKILTLNPLSQAGASNRDLEVVAEDEQQFLLRQQQYLQQGAPPPSVSSSALGGMPSSVQKTPDRKTVGSPGVQGSPKKVGLAERWEYCLIQRKESVQCL